MESIENDGSVLTTVRDGSANGGGTIEDAFGIR